ncbi:XRE family transcriptional regulator [Paenalcaligenes niemegkensis]|uniref:helix-turn-helix domain-containing protein n=1 Tax=Paenalcaligenes niemegkensis TaxID=2895469 RepID=UPI001EE96711|nr:XRE family transcriptional regulator [Paenalcaligenes niemegkensis]MCQ9617286.1 XRE family transcriptional regulator [Paenalcaligenes niemegkensis]
MTQTNDILDINETPEEEEAAVCQRLRELRKERRLTLDVLAERSGFTKGYLSKIENGTKAPPIGTLARIARAMSVDLSVFFVDESANEHQLLLSPDSPISVVHSWERKPVSRGGTEYGYDYVSLAHKKSNRSMDPFIFTYPQTTETHEFFEHTGEEFIYLLTGKVEFEFKIHGQLTRFLLEAGDSVYFESSTPHRGRALEGEAQAIVVITETDE